MAWELTDAGVVEVRRRGQRVSDRRSPGPVRIARGPGWPG
ncbi:MAG: DUF3253 domain-containing protein [Phycicoccus sp.]